ncbi:hypothetical protein ACFO3I_02750 [Rheinheimera marina]|uniref:Integrase n=1 Tax=Rheinheimera marina TaxID=1774958 RepID=A0ABV9JGY8_9GAMM
MAKLNAAEKIEVLPAELVQLWSQSDSRQEHYDKFVLYCERQLKHVFPTVDWTSNVWEISAFEPTRSARQLSHASNILFTRRNGLTVKKKVAALDQIPFRPPFLEFVKALVVLGHLGRPKTHGAHMVTMRAFRYLYDVFEDSMLEHIHQLSGVHFDQALMKAINHGEKEATLYRTGEHLSYIASQLNLLTLCSSFEWHNPVPRTYKSGGSLQQPLSGKSTVEQAEQLPKTMYLVHLAALWRHYDELEPADKMTVCMGVMLLCTGLRLDEFCGLHLGCIPSREEFDALPPELTFDGRMGKMLRMSVLARKRFVWDTKIIPASLTDTVFLVVERMKLLSEEARYYSQMLLEQQRWPALNGFNDDEIVLVKDLAEHFGFDKSSNLITQLERYGISRHESSVPKRTSFLIGDIHTGIAQAYRDAIGDVAEGFGPREHKIPIWEVLSLQFKFEHSRGSLKMCPLPLTGTQAQDAFRGRDYVSRLSKDGSRIQSLFERYHFEGLDVDHAGVRTHQFRHLLNTIMQQSVMFSQEDIAKYFLRAGVRDNEFYDHSSPKDLVMDAAKKLHAYQQKFAPQLQANLEEMDEAQVSQLIRRFPLLDPQELMAELDSRGSSHFMNIGRCRHDYTQEPCGKHYACLNKCKHYRRQKGNPSEIKHLMEMKDRAQQQIEVAQFDVDDGFANSHVWLAHHQRFLDGCNAALSIEEDSRYEVGQIVAIFPNGRDSCEAH